MRALIGRLLGYHAQVQRLTAQRDANKESWRVAVQAANVHARRSQDLGEMLEIREGHQVEAAELVRSAHRQLNLNGGTKRAQQQVLQAARLLEGGQA